MSVKPFMSILVRDMSLFKDVLNLFISDGKDIDEISKIFPFFHTDYYEEEMGKNLVRKFVALKELIKPDSLPALKHYTYSIENRFRNHHGMRRVNIDPGYIAPEKIVLSTFKNFGHRIYLRKEVYGELTLIYKDKAFKPLEWTFPDYAQEEVLRVLRSLRGRYLYQLRREEWEKI